MTRAAGVICRGILFGAALSASLLSFPSIGNAREGASPPAQARPMTAAELYTLFGGKSWQWPDGAGLMETEDRRFSAIAGSGKQSSWAVGRWSVTDGGRLCLIADWHSRAGTHANRTCFRHMIDNGTIYQRKEPAGGWYVFKHAQTKAGDEFKKLVRADLVSAELRKRQLGERPKKKKP